MAPGFGDVEIIAEHILIEGFKPESTVLDRRRVL
jgi:hypothetical protein